MALQCKIVLGRTLNWITFHHLSYNKNPFVCKNLLPFISKCITSPNTKYHNTACGVALLKGENLSCKLHKGNGLLNVHRKITLKGQIPNYQLSAVINYTKEAAIVDSNKESNDSQDNSIPLDHQERIKLVIDEMISDGIVSSVHSGESKIGDVMKNENKIGDDVKKVTELVGTLVRRKVQKKIIKKLFKNYCHLCEKVNVLRWDRSIYALDQCGFAKQDICLYLLPTHPKIFESLENEILDIVAELRHLGFNENQIHKLCCSDPTILTSNVKAIHQRFENLLGIFPKYDVFKLIRHNPKLLTQNWNDIQRKISYVDEEMGLDLSAIHDGEIFKKSFLHLKTRHLCLVRTGFYEKPNKHGITKVENASLRLIVDTNEKEFCSKLAGGLNIDEYRAFSVMVEVEENEEDFSGSDNDDEDIN